MFFFVFSYSAPPEWNHHDSNSLAVEEICSVFFLFPDRVRYCFLSSFCIKFGYFLLPAEMFLRLLSCRRRRLRLRWVIRSVEILISR